MPKLLSVAELREAYLSFFESKGCTRYASAPLVMRMTRRPFHRRWYGTVQRHASGMTCHSHGQRLVRSACARTTSLRLDVHRAITPSLRCYNLASMIISRSKRFRGHGIPHEVLEMPADRLWVTTHTIDDDAWNIGGPGLSEERMERLVMGITFGPLARQPTAHSTGWLLQRNLLGLRAWKGSELDAGH